MSGQKKKINKAKCIELCTDLLYSGKQRKEIVQQLTTSYQLSVSAVDKYIKEARIVVAKRKAADEQVAARVRAEQTEEVARRLGIDREWAMRKLKQIADFDIRKIYDEDGKIMSPQKLDDDTAAAIQAIEETEIRTAQGKIGINRKIKAHPVLPAIEDIGKMMGWIAPASVKAKVEGEDAAGNKKSFTVTLNLG